MSLALQICHYLVWFPLAILVLSAILRCGVRRYPLIFTYMTVTFLLAVAEMPSSLSVRGSHRTDAQMALHYTLYAVGQGLIHLLIFAVVVSFVLRTTEKSPIRHVIRTVLAIGGPLFILISFIVHYDGTAAMNWMPLWNRDLNFCAAIVDMVLWAFLLSSQKKDETLLLLVGGMGIGFAGDAITDAVRSIAIHYHTHAVWVSAWVFSIFADGASLYVWWQAFRRAPQATPSAFVQPAVNGAAK